MTINYAVHHKFWIAHCNCGIMCQNSVLKKKYQILLLSLFALLSLYVLKENTTGLNKPINISEARRFFKYSNERWLYKL